MEKNYKIVLTDDKVQDLELPLHQELQVVDTGKSIILKKNIERTETQTYSLRWFLIPTSIASICFFIFCLIRGEKLIPLTGDFSIASATLVLGLLIGMISFTVSFVLKRKENQSSFASNIYWRNFPTIVISFAIMLGLIIMASFWLIGEIFVGADFDLFTATLLFFVFAGIVNYTMLYFSYTLSPERMMYLLIVVIIGGVGFSMITNGQEQWWQTNFSFLGTESAQNAWQFNLTLIISALLMIALVDVLFISLQKKFPHNIRLTILRILLTLTAMSLGGVGFFPNNGLGRMHILHNKAANWLVYFIIILIVSCRFLLPKVAKEFLYLSYGLGVVLIVVDLVFELTNYLSLTAFELIAFILGFSWLLLFLQNLLKLLHDPEKYYTVMVVEDEVEQSTT